METRKKQFRIKKVGDVFYVQHRVWLFFWMNIPHSGYVNANGKHVDICEFVHYKDAWKFLNKILRR